MFNTTHNGAAAAYPASPAGMLLSGDNYSRKTSAKWAVAEQRVAAAQGALGLLLFLLSSLFFSHLTEATGQLLGVLLIISGALGWLGGARRSANIVNLQIMGSLLGVMLAFNLIGEVVRDTQIDCALAELFHRGTATERAVTAARQAEAMQSVFSRLNEMEDMLTLAQQGAAKQAELRQDQHALRMTDATYIRAKMDMIKRHAEEVLESVLKNPNITSEAITTMRDEEKAFLRRRLDVADDIMERIQQHHASKDAEITAEEYLELLHALTDTDVVPDKAEHPELQQAKYEMPNMAAALERQKSDVYHKLALGEAPQHLESLAAYRQQRRQQWESQFEQQLAEQNAAGGEDYLADLPEHCVKETRGEKAMVSCGVAAIVLQVAGAYVALSLSFRLPMKSA